MDKNAKNDYMKQLSIYYNERYIQETREQESNITKNKYNMRICKSQNNTIYKVSIDNF